jgi:hypothetical protein
VICFEVLLNGKVVCTAGLSDGMLHLYMQSIGRSLGVRINVGGTTFRRPDDLAPKLQAALQQPEPELAVHLKWLDERVNLGDEITVRIVERPECDPPTERHVTRPESGRRD